MGDGGVRISSAWLAAGPSFRGGAKVHSGRRSADYALYSGALHVSCLGDQHESDPSRCLAFLRRASRYGTSHLRTARRLCHAKDPDGIVRSQFAISGNHSTGLKSGHHISTQLSGIVLADSNTPEITI